MRLYHFTCLDHGATSIERDGLIRPGSHLGIDLPQSMFAWFTDLDATPREALGLTSQVAKCDRMARRYTVKPDRIFPWMLIRKTLPWHFVEALESTEGAMPRHWFVSAEPVEVDE